MNVGKYSENLFARLALEYHVTQDNYHVIFNYLVYGFNPGSFYTAFFANDMVNCLTHSHPGNNLSDLKNLAVFLVNLNLDNIAWGNYKVVDEWMKMSEDKRRDILVSRNLLYTEEEEIVMILKDIPLIPVRFLY